MTKRSISQTIFTLLGMLTALAAAEVALRPLASAWRDTSSSRPAEVRQYYEGIATAHYAADGERLIGNPSVENAQHILILGDSHVEAIHVDDSATMGAVLERHARAAGVPINVHQYGWSYSAAPTYAHAAPGLLARWKAASVIVILNPADLEQAFQGPIRINPPTAEVGIPEIIQEPPATRSGWRYRLGRPVLGNSVLAYQLYISARMMQQAALSGEDDDEEEIPGEQRISQETPGAALASVRLLRAAYGERLLIVYDPFLFGLHTQTIDDGKTERQLMESCAHEHVRCISTRDAFTHDRVQRSRFARGFSNTAPGGGHWNATGHAILGELIWQQLQVSGR